MLAQEQLRELCGDRPGLGSSTCIVDAGHVQVETGLSWTRTDDLGIREDVFLVGDTLLRLGLDERTEVQLGFTAFGHVRVRTPLAADEESGIGDITVALRRNLISPDGSGTNAAVQVYATLPTGDDAIGAGDWSAGILLPFGFDLSETLSVAFTPQASLEPDSDGEGHHASFGGSAGIGITLSDRLGAAVDLAVIHDDDPAGSGTEALLGLSMTLGLSANVQLDAGLNIGLNDDSPDTELYAGIVTRF